MMNSKNCKAISVIEMYLIVPSLLLFPGSRPYKEETDVTFQTLVKYAMITIISRSIICTHWISSVVYCVNYHKPNSGKQVGIVRFCLKKLYEVENRPFFNGGQS